LLLLCTRTTQTGRSYGEKGNSSSCQQASRTDVPSLHAMNALLSDDSSSLLLLHAHTEASPLCPPAPEIILSAKRQCLLSKEKPIFVDSKCTIFDTQDSSSVKFLKCVDLGNKQQIHVGSMCAPRNVLSICASRVTRCETSAVRSRTRSAPSLTIRHLDGSFWSRSQWLRTCIQAKGNENKKYPRNCELFNLKLIVVRLFHISEMSPQRTRKDA
jgi:hypothetical protein